MTVSLRKASDTPKHPDNPVEITKHREPTSKINQSVAEDLTAPNYRKIIYLGILAMIILSLSFIFSGGEKSAPRTLSTTHTTTTPVAASNPSISVVNSTAKQLTIAVANGDLGAYGCHGSIEQQAKGAFSLACIGYKPEQANTIIDALRSRSADLAIVPTHVYEEWAAQKSVSSIKALIVLGKSKGELIWLVVDTSALSAKQALIVSYLRAFGNTSWATVPDLLLNSNLSAEFIPLVNTAELFSLDQGLKELTAHNKSMIGWVKALVPNRISPSKPTPTVVAIPSEKDAPVKSIVTGSEFDPVINEMIAFTEGVLFKILALMMIIMGVGQGIMQKNILAAAVGIGGGMFIQLFPEIIRSILMTGAGG